MVPHNGNILLCGGLENEKKLMWENQQRMEHNLRKELEEEKAARIADTEKMNKEVQKNLQADAAERLNPMGVQEEDDCEDD